MFRPRPRSIRQRPRPLGLAVLCALVLSLLAVDLARAQQVESGAQYWLHERQRQEKAEERARRPIIQRPTHLIRRAAPVRGFARPAPEATKNAAPPSGSGTPLASPGGSPAPAGTTAPAPAETTKPIEATTPATAPATAAPSPAAQAQPAGEAGPKQTFTVLVIGDSMGQMLGQGLTEAFADRPDVVILRRAKDSSGLVRDDYFDWVKNAREILATSGKVDMAVMMVGSNDNQPLREGGKTLEPLTPEWKAAYTKRVEAIDDMFREKKIPLLWVGAPIMRSDRLTAAMLQLDEIYRTAAARTHETYIDIWEAFSDERSRYSAYGPDLDGQITKIRSGDGVHFTKAGARKLAHFAEIEIRRALESNKPQVDPAVAKLAPQLAPADLAAPQPASPATQTPKARAGKGPPDLQSLLPVPAAPVQPIIPIRPAAGPVLPLTTPVLSPGGQLASITPKPSTTEADRLVERALVEGRPLDPRQGRADDFHWPHD